MDDHGLLAVSLPATGTQVTASIVSEDQMLGFGCRVVAVKQGKSSVDVLFYLGETNGDDGWNGCTAQIARAGYENGLGVLTVEFGYRIRD